MTRLNTKVRVGRGVQTSQETSHHKNNEHLLKEKMKDIIESEKGDNQETKKVAQPVDISPFKRRTDIEVFYSNSKRQKPKTWKL